METERPIAVIVIGDREAVSGDRRLDSLGTMMSLLFKGFDGWWVIFKRDPDPR
jgi:hypothetical protein